MKKVLFVASVPGHIIAFHLPYLKWLKENGYQVHIAVQGNREIPYCDKKYDLPFERSPLKKNNIKAYLKLKKIMKVNEYDIIHCHTPVASILTRLAARNSRKKKGTKVIYTAHGFHFFKGAPLINWLIYYPLEKLMAHYTDVLITINHEDYERAKRFKAKQIKYIPGVGIDLKKFDLPQLNRDEKRKELGLSSDDIVLLSVGELNKNKNHEIIIRALAQIENKDIKYCIAGIGSRQEYLVDLARRLHVETKVKFLGHRPDIAEVYQCVDIFCFPSLREGLPVSLMEAMASGLPCIASRIRGNTDLMRDGEGGILCNNNIKEYMNAIEYLVSHPALRNRMDGTNRESIKPYSLIRILKNTTDLYTSITR